MSYFNLKYLILANKKIFWYLHIHTHLLLLFAVNLERYPFYTHCRWIVPFEDFVLFLYLYLYDLRTLYEGPEIQNGKYSFFDNMFSETQIFKYVALLPLSFTLEVALIESFPPSSEQSSFNAGNPTTALWLWGFGRLVEYKDLCILIQYSVDANKGLIWIVNGAVVQQNMQKSQWTKVLTEGREIEAWTRFANSQCGRLDATVRQPICPKREFPISFWSRRPIDKICELFVHGASTKLIYFSDQFPFSTQPILWLLFCNLGVIRHHVYLSGFHPLLHMHCTRS